MASKSLFKRYKIVFASTSGHQGGGRGKGSIMIYKQTNMASNKPEPVMASNNPNSSIAFNRPNSRTASDESDLIRRFLGPYYDETELEALGNMSFEELKAQVTTDSGMGPLESYASMAFDTSNTGMISDQPESSTRANNPNSGIASNKPDSDTASNKSDPVSRFFRSLHRVSPKTPDDDDEARLESGAEFEFAPIDVDSSIAFDELNINNINKALAGFGQGMVANHSGSSMAFDKTNPSAASDGSDHRIAASNEPDFSMGFDEIQTSMDSDESDSSCDLVEADFRTETRMIPCIARVRWKGLGRELDMRFAVDYKPMGGRFSDFVYQRDSPVAEKGRVYIDPAMRICGEDRWGNPMLKAMGFIHDLPSIDGFPVCAQLYAKEVVCGKVGLNEDEIRQLRSNR
ncbi:MAG: hypothetical protein Q9191_000580 [Dirinaria sp. TL-2023a]